MSGIEHRAIGQTKAGGAVEQLQGEAGGTHRDPEESAERLVSGSRFAACWCHLDQTAAGIELQHGIGIGLADSRKLFGGQPEICREPQRCQGVSGRS